MKHTEPKYAGCKVVVSTHELALHGIMTLNYIQKKAGLFSGIGTRPGSFSVNKVNVAVARRNVKTKKKIKNVRNAFHRNFPTAELCVEPKKNSEATSIPKLSEFVAQV